MKKQPKYLLRPALLALLLVGLSATAQERARSESSVYYRLGGGEPSARANYPRTISTRIGLGGTLRLNYSCGRFDVGASWASLMEGIKSYGDVLELAIKATISSLPMYALQRAQPGLYEMFQTYSQKADVLVASYLKSCEEREAQIQAGENPYEDWIKLAKGEEWKVQASTSGNLVKAKYNVEKDSGKRGIPWVGGANKGGIGQAPIRLVEDLVNAGYNATLNQPVLTPDGAYASPSDALSKSRLMRAFAKPSDAAQYAAEVMGDLTIALCDDDACPAKGSRTGTGLSPKMEAELPSIETNLNALLASPNPDYTQLDKLAAPSVSISREVLDGLRELPPQEQAIVKRRLSLEIALARTINKAFAVRELLLTALTLPEVTASNVAQRKATEKLAVLNRSIDDLMFESRVRKELVSSTAGVILDSYMGRRGYSNTLAPQGRSNPNRLINGVVTKP
jgi:integrating conjugative element protein (TIGR03755 family)